MFFQLKKAIVALCILIGGLNIPKANAQFLHPQSTQQVIQPMLYVTNVAPPAERKYIYCQIQQLNPYSLNLITVCYERKYTPDTPYQALVPLDSYQTSTNSLNITNLGINSGFDSSY
jgi:hypothetical protein